MILARHRALTCMKLQGIIPKHQVLNNKLSATHRTEICDTYMTFQLVPPDDHRRNLADRDFKPGRTTSLVSSVAPLKPSRSICGARPSHKPNGNYSSYNSPI